MLREQEILTILQQQRLKQLKLLRRRTQEFALHHTLFILTFRSGVDRYSTTNSKRRPLRFRVNHHRPNRDVEDTVSAGFEQPDRARVRTARVTLEFAHDLHRANLPRS